MANTKNLVSALLTDKYQIRMSYSYWRRKMYFSHAVFEFFTRKNPFGGEFTIFAGLEDCLELIENFRYSENEIEYLRNLSDFRHFEESFWTTLAKINSESVKLYAMQEGSVCFPNEPLMRIEGPLGIAQLYETTLINLISYPSLVATNAVRYKLAAVSGNMSSVKLYEFGLRRSQGPNGGFVASRSIYIGGFDATSNLKAGLAFGIPTCGTMSHAYIMAHTKLVDFEKDHEPLPDSETNQLGDFKSKCEKSLNELRDRGVFDARSYKKHYLEEFRAFINYAIDFPNDFLVLVDTYDVIKSGLVNFCAVAIALSRSGFKPKGIRIDSGDLAYLSSYSRRVFMNVAKVFDMEDFDHLHIIVSNDINEETIKSLKDQQHAITGMGIGTHLVTCQNQPALGVVCKLVEVAGNPCMKISSVPEKTSMPYKKSSYRLFGKDGRALLDLIVASDEPEPLPSKKILCRHPFDYQKQVYATPSKVEPLLILAWDGKARLCNSSLEDARNRVKDTVNFLTDDVKRPLNPTPYKVSLSENLFNLIHNMKLDLNPIGEIS